MYSRDFMRTKEDSEFQIKMTNVAQKLISKTGFQISPSLSEQDINGFLKNKLPSDQLIFFSLKHLLKKKYNITKKKILSKLNCMKNIYMQGENSKHIDEKEKRPYCNKFSKVSRVQTVLHKVNPLVRNAYDFSCQSSLNSNHSLEITSHILTRSVSQNASIDSIFNLNWRKCCQRQNKQLNVLQFFLINLTRKLKNANSKLSRKTKKSNVIILHIPKNFSSLSADTTFTSEKREREEPLKIYDNPRNEAKLNTVISRCNKICGPGEIISLLKLKESGRVRNVGVSNVSEDQLRRLCAVEKPACLQVEVHLLCQQRPLLAVANELGIPVVAYSPLGSKALADALAAKTGREYPDLLQLPTVVRIAKIHQRTPAQVLLRYLLQHGVAAVPKSTNPTRIKQNITVWDFELSDSEMTELSSLDRGENGRICDFAFFPGIEKHPEFPFKK